MKAHLKLLIALCLLPILALAETPEERGLAIAQQADDSDLGFESISVDLTMVLIDASGNETVRKVERKTLEVDGDGEKNINIFQSPEDVKGTTVLTHTHVTTPDDQWILLPALKRVKRIATANKSGPFMGSEFAFEDIAAPEVSKYTYRFLRDEEQEGAPCYVQEMTPTYEYSGYSRLVEWLDKQMLTPRKIEYYDRNNKLIKTLSFKGYRQYLAKHWRPDVMLMENHVNGRKTKLLWNNYRFRVGLDDSAFSLMALNRSL